MPEIPLDIAEIDDRIAILRNNLRELVEQAAAYSGAADEELISRRIAEQEAQLAHLTKQRDELSRGSRGADPTSLIRKAVRHETRDHRIKKRMEVVGADDVHIGTVDRVENGKIRLSRRDSGQGHHKGHQHIVDLSLVADVEGQKVRLSANAAVAVTFEEEQSGEPI